MNTVLENDGWVLDGRSILSDEVLQKIEHALKQSVIVVEHRFYRGAKAPSRMIFEKHNEFVTYVKANSKAGDSYWIWSYLDVCTDKNAVASGKFPDEQGRTPKRGAY